MLTSFLVSLFPNPTKDERRAYALYWKKKLASNKAIEFPDSLVDEVAEATPKFSFSYLKEALSVPESNRVTFGGHLADPHS